MEAVCEEALKEEKPPGNDNMDLELPEETENMIDRFLNYASHPTLPTTTGASLLPPLMNENNGHQFVTSSSDTGNPPHMGLSDNITLPDGGLATKLPFRHRASSSLPYLKCPGTRAPYHAEIAEQLKSDPKRNSPCELHHGPSDFSFPHRPFKQCKTYT